MPKATINVGETTRFELKTLPADGTEEAGFVELRRMSYGEYLARRDMISEMSFKGQGKEQQAVMKMLNEEVARYEFQTCIVDHNLEDANGKNLDFRSAKAFKQLAPNIGEEVSELIDKYNGFNESDDDDDDLETRLGNSSETSTE